jgi:predicted metal-binding protein
MITANGDGLPYEYHEGVVSMADVVHGESYEVGCSTCPRRGLNLACPPHSPSFAEYAAGAESLRVLCVRMPVVGPGDVQKPSSHARDLLTDELLQHRARGRRVMGAGPCRACAKCAALEGATRCSRPKKLIYSLESLGVNVVALTESALRLALDWNDMHFVCAVGGVLVDRVGPQDDSR